MDINFTEQLKNILELSRQEAVRHNNDIINPEHMFLAILGDTGSKVFSLLEKISAPPTARRLNLRHLVRPYRWGCDRQRPLQQAYKTVCA